MMTDSALSVGPMPEKGRMYEAVPIKDGGNKQKPKLPLRLSHVINVVIIVTGECCTVLIVSGRNVATNVANPILTFVRPRPTRFSFENQICLARGAGRCVSEVCVETIPGANRRTANGFHVRVYKAETHLFYM